MFLLKTLQRLENLGLRLQLGMIPTTERLPLPRVMGKPLPQGIAGSSISQPEIHLGLCLRHASWPEPVHEYTCPIFWVGWLVDPFYFEHVRLIRLSVPPALPATPPPELETPGWCRRQRPAEVPQKVQAFHHYGQPNVRR